MMPTENSLPQFKYGTQAEIDALTSKDASTFYYTTDTHKIYLGSDECTKSLETLSAEPVNGTTVGLPGKIYSYNNSLYSCDGNKQWTKFIDSNTNFNEVKLDSNCNLDDIVTPGWYYAEDSSSMTNKPSVIGSSDYFRLRVYTGREFTETPQVPNVDVNYEVMQELTYKDYTFTRSISSTYTQLSTSASAHVIDWTNWKQATPHKETCTLTLNYCTTEDVTSSSNYDLVTHSGKGSYYVLGDLIVLSAKFNCNRSINYHYYGATITNLPIFFTSNVQIIDGEQTSQDTFTPSLCAKAGYANGFYADSSTTPGINILTISGGSTPSPSTKLSFTIFGKI